MSEPLRFACGSPVVVGRAMRHPCFPGVRVFVRNVRRVGTWGENRRLVYLCVDLFGRRFVFPINPAFVGRDEIARSAVEGCLRAIADEQEGNP